MSITNKLFTERFRPETLDSLVLSERVLNIVKYGLKQNILLSSPPGRGKTSLAYILTKMDNIPYLYINASRETSVDIVREQIVNWCSEPSLIDSNYGRIKAVILDEVDGFSEQAFKALRGTIEQFADEARFIATCNYIEKIPEAIRSRFNIIDLEPQTNEEEKELKIKYYNKAAEIVQNVGLTTNKEGIIRLVDVHFPDMRAIVNTVESLFISLSKEFKKSFTADEIKKFNASYEDLYKLILGKQTPLDTYKFVNENYSNKIDDLLVALGSDFIEYIRDTNNQVLIPKIPEIIVCVADHQYKTKFTIDKFVNLLSCIYKIQLIIK